MDQMGEVEYAPGEPKGTPWHPHRGFETVTYIIDGVFRHQDSNGGGGLITNGDTQWMTAGGGILHIEEPPEELVMSGGLFHGFQLWVNLPRRLKMTAAALPGHPRPAGVAAVLGRRRRADPGHRRRPGRAPRPRRHPHPDQPAARDPAARRAAAPALAQRLQRAGLRAGRLRHGRPGPPPGPHRPARGVRRGRRADRGRGRGPRRDPATSWTSWSSAGSRSGSRSPRTARS